MVLIITILMVTTTMVVTEARTARHGEMQNSKAAQRANFLDQRAETVTLDLNMESLLRAEFEALVQALGELREAFEKARLWTGSTQQVAEMMEYRKSFVSTLENTRILQERAEAGHVDAQVNLGFLYYKGDIVKQSDEKAVEWWEKAAMKGYSYAQHNLGGMYHDGRGVEQNHKKAVELYTMAAMQGQVEAFLLLCFGSGFLIQGTSRIRLCRGGLLTQSLK